MVKQTERQRFEDQSNHYFAEALSNPNSWLGTAANLILVCEKIETEIPVLWKGILDDKSELPTLFTHPEKMEHRLLDTYLMLMGFAMENILKAIIVSQDPNAYKNKALRQKKLPADLDGHGLLELAASINFELDAEEKSVLGRLEDHLVWAGRYPVPTKPSSYDHAFAIPSRTSSLFRMYTNTDIHTVKHIIERLQAEFHVTLPKVAGYPVAQADGEK